MLKLTVFVFLTSFNLVHSADVEGLNQLFSEKYDELYQDRFCGRNIEEFLKEAEKRNIDLSNSKVLSFVGHSFLNTYGFYWRGGIDSYKPLWFFHVVLLADNQIFDFHMAHNRSVNLEKYVRLMFTPPPSITKIYNIDVSTTQALKSWEVEFYNSADYSDGLETLENKLSLSDFVSFDAVMKLPRSI